ncbi:hypothetical protein TNIN_107831 [Trichonephila inaurata madagascariensis]|uniref:Uncharacterized protein n=1 Tax=Trichonephila inaurata madagascariensis TaxID=2747483 RepID=A0A8X6YGW8_9ARAC|nr:hypothetical protein TNIN_107831 [Trichonephila inaurata madagascariensis]
MKSISFFAPLIRLERTFHTEIGFRFQYMLTEKSLPRCTLGKKKFLLFLAAFIYNNIIQSSFFTLTPGGFTRLDLKWFGGSKIHFRRSKLDLIGNCTRISKLVGSTRAATMLAPCKKMRLCPT